mgnify:CR=1
MNKKSLPLWHQKNIEQEKGLLASVVQQTNILLE